MKKLFLGALVFLLLGIFIGRVAPFKVASLPEIVPAQQEFQLPARTDLPAQAKISQTLESAPKGDSALVVRVIDGDTVELDTGERLRYIGMDTPESVDPRKPVQCFGLASASRNREFVEGKTVRLEKDVEDKDKYGRLLRYVWIGDKMINLELVEEGYATAFTYPPDVKYSKEFVVAESKAREAKIGLWQSCH